MATSGSKSVTVTAHDTLKFSWSQSSQSITNNTTTISWKLQLITDAYGRISSTASKSWSVTVNGKKYSGTNTVGIGNSSTKTLASGTTTIAHNSDGTKTFSYSFSQQFAITFSGTHIGTKSGSGTGTLNTIPRASSFGTITGNTIGSGITININRNSTSFTHTLWYSFGSLTWQGIGSSIGTSATFTPPLSICSQVPSSTSGTMTLILRTYNGTTQIGSDVYKTITVYVPSSVVPSISRVTISEANTSVVPSSWGVYVQNKTKLKFVTSATAGTGSSIASVTVSINGKSYSGTTATTNIITASGNLTATITAKDLRGRSASTTKTVTIQAYSNPYISNFTIIRCDSSGKASEAGSYAKVTFVGGRSSVSSKNTGSYSFQYKKSTASSYTTYNFSVTSSTINTSVILSGIDTNYSYSFIGIVKDYFTSIKTAAKTLSSAFVTVDYLNGGHGIAFGKVAETSNLLEVEFPAKFNNSLITKGILCPISGMRVHSAGGTAGTAGYVKIATINITGAYANQPIEMTIAQRGKWNPAKLTIFYNSANSTDPTLASFAYTSYQTYSIYIVKSATSTWDLYVQKTEGYDSIAILNFEIGSYAGARINLTWKDEQASSVPTGYTQASNALYGNVLPLTGGTLTGLLKANSGIVIPNEGSTAEPNNRIMGITTSGAYHHLLSISSNNNCAVNYGSYKDGIGTLNLYTSDIVNIITKDNGSMYISGRSMGFKDAYTGSFFIACTWKDSAVHDIVSRATDGLASYIGPGSLSGYNTVTSLRGNTVRVYAHSGAVYLGSSGSTAITSDRNLKKDIYDLDEKYVTFFMLLRSITYKYDNPENKGHRDHIGFIAQEVEEALLKAGLTTEEFAGLVIEKNVTLNPNHDSSLSEEENKANEIHYDKLYSLRYEEFIALNTYMIQKQQKEIDDLKSENTALRKELDELKELVNKLAKSA